jgi:ferredoxin
VNENRRAFLQSTFIPAIVTILPEIIGGDTTESIQSGYDESRKHPISPPGSVSVARFSNLCTACHLCINSCPTQVLYPSFLDYGLAGILQPKMNYAASYCNYDCVICSQVCPTGAILPLNTVTKKEIQIGKAHFVKNDCIVVTKKTDCAACSEHCPTKAVRMVPFDHLFLPEVNNEICVGCGACEHACPTNPRKAIYVNANLIHQKAKKPEIQKIEKTYDGIQEFPF